MSWSAKPSGAYSYTSTEGAANIEEMISIFSSAGYSDAAITSIITNCIYEGGLNPWRWQGDTYGTSRGYGLFQFTPASGYINLSGATPNLSTTETTSGASAEDGAYQCECVVNDTLGKWVSSNWRSYWDTSTYSVLYDYSQDVLDTWGNGSSISQDQFMEVTDIEAALFIFFACFEGPGDVSDFYERRKIVKTIYKIVTGTSVDPSDPSVPPSPSTPVNHSIWFYYKMSDRNRGYII